MRDVDQRAGDYAQQIQANNVEVHNHGLSAADVVEIAMVVFKQNFTELSESAMAKAFERVEQFTEVLMRRLQDLYPSGVESASEPAIQRAIYSAQTEYATSGDWDLGHTLVDLLAERVSESSDSLHGIILTEALSVVPKLTKEQIASLSAILAIRYTRHTPWRTVDDFYAGLRKILSPLIGKLPSSPAAYRHMAYAGVGTATVTWDLLENLPKLYPALFTNGFTIDNVPEKLRPLADAIEHPFITARRHPFRLQLVYQNVDEMIAEGVARDPSKERNEYVELLMSHLMQRNEVYDDLVQNIPEMDGFVIGWHDSPIGTFELTTVGIAIARANLARFYPELPDLDYYLDQAHLGWLQ
ncbi:LPO_1073/Vpar_1526 family protein [Nocardia vaccinii]|uniref:LPO_1073/Vpar_1526 family protein n=1 Tax=Nocardia vaccinii TaxID=1822 RepID=UPI000834C8C0|nr:LPO_1073/Vpar_1526 family protein [Nocardia vaccinii]